MSTSYVCKLCGTDTEGALKRIHDVGDCLKAIRARVEWLEGDVARLERQVEDLLEERRRGV